MKQVVGYVKYNGQFGDDYAGKFDVEKVKDGVYVIKFADPFDSYPVVSLTPISEYMTANAVVARVDHGNSIEVRTGFTDKPSTEYMDCSFLFTAVGP